ncbi:MAG: DUF4270 family protein [Ferruginibacter sp.]
MQKRLLSLVLVVISVLVFFTSGCSKLDTTDVGTDMLPAVDNVHTFLQTFDVNTTQGYINDDTAFVVKAGDHLLGYVNDPLFGTTEGSIFMQIKPQFFPYYIGRYPTDTLLGLDSAVLCLKVKDFWGDSTQPVHLSVYPVFDNAFRDSVIHVFDHNYKPNYTGFLLGSTDVDIRRLPDTVHYTNNRDYSVGLIRIKLDYNWALQLYHRDSLSGNPANNAFYNDTTYRSFYHGLAVVCDGPKGQALMYVNLADTSTKIEMHYRRTNVGVKDTTYASFRVITSTYNTSSTANFVKRVRGGASLSPAPGELYIQTGVNGSCANLKIPGLDTFKNCIIHRAELIIKQIPTNPFVDSALSCPSYLLVDLKDTGANNFYKPIYYDLNPSSLYDPDLVLSSIYWPDVDHASFGGYPRSTVDNFGNSIKYFNINISRYVQQLITRHSPNYTLRLYAPYEVYYPKYTDPYRVGYGNNLCAGRVRIGGGNNVNYKMTVRVIYSKL